MNKRQFVRSRRGAWARFEVLVERFDSTRIKHIPAKEVSEFSRLFRELSNDLAVIRSRSWGERLVGYLNHLVARGHNVFYGSTTIDPIGGKTVSPHVAFTATPVALAKYVAFDFPRLFRKNIGYFIASSLLLFLPMFVSWYVVQNEPSLATRVMDPLVLEMMSEMYNYDPDDPERGVFARGRSQMAGFYVYNNAGIALKCFTGGILMGTFTVYILLSNGISIGTIFGYLIGEGHGPALLSFVVTHGSFELTAIAISGGAGLMLGDAMIHRGQRTLIESLRVKGYEAVQIAAGAAIMLFIAALIEAFWSPLGIPSMIKYIVGGGMWVLVFAYLAFAGRGK